MRKLLLALLVFSLMAAACSSSDGESSGEDAEESSDAEASEGEIEKITIGAIPDQDPEVLARNYGLVADYLSDELGVEVEFQPVTEYDAAVTQFKVGDLDLVWFGGLTGVQARLQVEGATAIAQRDIDAEFTSVFIARTDSDLAPIDSVEGLADISGRTFTFGSDSSTSGRLMPQAFLSQAGVALEDLDGEPGFSGSHDTTIELVAAGTFEVGALNSQVWAARVEDGTVDPAEVQVIFETPTYYDYHWVAHPDLGGDLTSKVQGALKNLDPSNADHAEILEFFGAGSFIETTDGNYADLESVGREVGLIEG